VRARLRIVLDAIVYTVPLITLLIVASEWNGIPGQPLRDTAAYHLAAEAARTGADIYDPLPSAGPHEFRGEYPFLYPPPLAALLSFLPEMSLTTFDRLWLCLNIVAFWVFAASIARIASGAWTVRSTLRWGAATLFLPGAWLAIHFANIDMMILALVAFGLARPPIAGACLTLAAAFKVVPVWAFATRVLRRPRETVRSAAVAAAVCSAACFVVFGIVETVELSLRWVVDVMPTVSQGQFWGESLSMVRSGLDPIHYTSNLSLSFMPVQIAVLNGWEYDGGPLPSYVRFYLTAVGVLAPLLAAWLTRRRSPTLQTTVVFAAALFAAPIVRPYVLPVLLLVLAAIIQEKRSARLTPAA